MNRLLLFDIDCTLIDTGGAGMAALKQAACEVFGAEGPELDLAGSTDASIVNGMLAHFGSDASHDDFYQVYLSLLEPNLTSCNGRTLPGVEELLRDLERNDVPMALLTGNIAAGAEAKLIHYGLDHYFPFGAYGDDHHDRNLLGSVALERAHLHHGIRFEAEHTVVIGDTPKDVACGKAIGAVTLGVATGGFSVEQLADCGADLVVADLTGDEVGDFLRG